MSGCCGTFGSWMGFRCNSHSETKTNVTDYKSRSCTDVPLIIAFMIGIALMVSIIYVPSIKAGNPDRLINAVDFAGNVCGIDSNVKDKPFAYWPYTPIDQPQTLWKSKTFKICTNTCNVTNDNNTMVTATYQSKPCMFKNISIQCITPILSLF